MASKIFKAGILGAPGSGKGTISSRIIKNFNLEHISSGDKLRLNIKNNTVIGIQAKRYATQGELVPDSIMIKFILSEIEKANNRSWLLDGFPRTAPQARRLWESHKLNLVLNLSVPYEVIIERVKNRWIHLPSGRVYNIDFNAPKEPGKDDITGEPLVQREDDKPEVVMRRLQAYDEITRPMVNFFKEVGIFQDFQGNTSDEIWPKVLKCLKTYLPNDTTANRI